MEKGFCVGGGFCYQQKRTHLFTGIITCILGIIAFWQHPFDAQFGESFFGELFSIPDHTARSDWCNAPVR